ncbi:MAG: type II toxin-antitoxin system VapC family toxin [Mucilaginibacter sp.]
MTSGNGKVFIAWKNVFLDTAPLIYFIEGHSEYQEVLSRTFDANEKKDFIFITSSITLLEVLVKPLKDGNTKLAEQYKNILINAPGIELPEVTHEVAIKAAELRAKYNLRTPDSIQIATAIVTKASSFLTNDVRLKSVGELKIVALGELE